ncbi:isomerase [Marmoricola endophyticus]|uniref:Isomerase n=1 Tax=Marmoricola endophyticus TaxID=2040280 RepID=A0A917F737_9ACTN|nr:histidine phosphatase family protein [Marmoricola endophyticus]GGF54757.1 isomerase [Marmoricola endophyticus]
MELILVRHAETTSNVSRAIDTAHPGADLTDLGARQAADVASYLAGTSVGAMYVSPRLRTRRTAEPLAAALGLEPELRDGLVEISAGDWEMSTSEERRSEYATTVAAWLTGDVSARIPGGEQPDSVFARFDAVVDEALASGHERVLVVSHGAVLRAWCGARVQGLNPESLRERPLRNTAVIRIERAGERWRLLEWDARDVPGPPAPLAEDPGAQ